MMNDVAIVGIDLGTTNSLIAIWEPEEDQSRVFSNCEGERLTKSVVAFDAETGGMLVGKPAMACFAEQPSQVAYSVKRFIGRTVKDQSVSLDREHLSYSIEETGDEAIFVRLGQRKMTPSEISAEILRKLKRDGEAELGGKLINEAVITVPAYFNEAQRQATKEAGELAGLKVPRIISEPTAAALAFGLGRLDDKAQTIAVYDLGGGTFDISILRIEKSLFHVIATGGDTHLGGDDLDQAIVKWLAKECETSLPRMKDAAMQAKLREKAQAAKETLSNRTECEIDLPGQFDLDRPVVLTRSKLEELTGPFINQTLELCASVLEKASLKADAIDQVLLIGGQTRMPAVRNGLRGRFGWKLNDLINPDEAVAQGAAIMGAYLSGHLRDRMRLQDVIPISLGIELADGTMKKIVKANQVIPYRTPRENQPVFTTEHEGQERIQFRIYQGEHTEATRNALLGMVTLNLAIARPAGEPRINCEFTVDRNGILHVRAEDADIGGQSVEMTFDYQYKPGVLEVDERDDESIK